VKQILQNARTGSLELAEVPAPSPERGQLLVRTAFSVVSPGTDKLVMEFARKSLVGKARSRPDQEGPLPTWRAVQGRLEVPQPLGYSSAGIVEAVGDGVAGIAPGDRVACAGAGYANHAELVVVPENLAARVPEGVPLEHRPDAGRGRCGRRARADRAARGAVPARERLSRARDRPRPGAGQAGPRPRRRLGGAPG
jgi:NADPH:quinone reductase-like Zn-dependent oxidoreductase